MNIRQLQILLIAYRSRLSHLDKDTLQKLAHNRASALEYAERAIGATEPENLNEKYIKTIANEMQLAARKLLNKEINT